MITSHVKITCYFHMWKYHRCYGYIINCAVHRKKLFQWNGLVLHWCLNNKWNTAWPLSHVENISLVCRACSRNIFQHSQRNFVSLRGHVISSIYYLVCANFKTQSKFQSNSLKQIEYFAQIIWTSSVKCKMSGCSIERLLHIPRRGL